MSAEHTQTFPDTSGKIISSGNLRDMTQLAGLQGRDTFVFQHSHQPGAHRPRTDTTQTPLQSAIGRECESVRETTDRVCGVACVWRGER